jgi:amino acid adenylation domain-containing protein
MEAIHEIFEQQATQTPQKVAVKLGDETMTYAELSHNSDLMAAHLVHKGCNPGDVIAVLMGRSIEMIVSILAILKAGGVYLPLDPNNPVERNLHCIDEAQVQILLTDTALPVDLVRENVLISADVYKHLKVSSSDVSFQPVNVDGDSPCYIVYTSGSTGKPKGVIAPHRGVFRLVIEPNYINIGANDSIIQFAPLSFDAATFEIWGALLNGGTLVLYSGISLDPNLLASELKDNQISIMFVTTALFHIIANHFIESFASLKYLLTGGDVLNPELMNKVAEHYPKLTLMACYGPTENTTFTSTYPIRPNQKCSGNVPIGREISGTTIHILGEGMVHVPQGDIGELFVSGRGVALGYVNREKSKNDFFEDESVDSGLIYRTGDLVRMNHNGDIEFIGRTDNQVKIRGFRASLEEIQSAIVKISHVDESVVMVEKFDSGDQLLIAYVQLKNNVELTGRELKKLLSAELPEYLIPDRFHINIAFPINSNGKVCKKSLREMVEFN